MPSHKNRSNKKYGGEQPVAGTQAQTTSSGWFSWMPSLLSSSKPAPAQGQLTQGQGTASTRPISGGRKQQKSKKGGKKQRKQTRRR
jgi:hypothetical protein